MKAVLRLLFAYDINMFSNDVARHCLKLLERYTLGKELNKLMLSF